MVKVTVRHQSIPGSDPVPRTILNVKMTFIYTKMIINYIDLSDTFLLFLF